MGSDYTTEKIYKLLFAHRLLFNYLWHSLTFDHHFIANLYSWLTESLQYIGRVQAREVGMYQPLMKTKNKNKKREEKREDVLEMTKFEMNEIK